MIMKENGRQKEKKEVKLITNSTVHESLDPHKDVQHTYNTYNTRMHMLPDETMNWYILFY